jgi:TPR repeat protein
MNNVATVLLGHDPSRRSEAMTWYEKAIAQGDTRAMYLLAFILVASPFTLAINQYHFILS